MFQFKFTGHFVNSVEPWILISSQIQRLKPVGALEIAMEEGVVSLQALTLGEL